MEGTDRLVWSGLQPHTPQHREGERLLFLLLSAADDPLEGVPAWNASWAFQRTDGGRDSLRFLAERFGFDGDLPKLCPRGPSGEPRHADRELALLMHWAEESEGLGPNETARLALRRACPADELPLDW